MADAPRKTRGRAPAASPAPTDHPLAVGISLGAAEQDFDITTELLGRPLRVRRVGADGSLAAAARLVRTWDSQAAALGIGVARDVHALDPRRSSRHTVARLADEVRHSPFSTGQRLADLLLAWAVRHAQASQGPLFNNAHVLFFSGLAHPQLAHALGEVTPNLHFADPLLQLGVPKLLTSLDALALYAEGAHHVADWVPPQVLAPGVLSRWCQHTLRHAARHASVIVAPAHALDGLGLEELAGKTVITHTVNEARLADWRDKGVHLVIDASPSQQGHALDPALLDAMIMAATGRHSSSLLDDDYLDIIEREGFEPRLIHPGGYRRINRFAFVIHPLSQAYFKALKPVALMERLGPPVLMDSLETVLAYAPPFVYSQVSGIRSPTGVEAEGWLISIGGTPREIMRRPPAFTYRRLLAAAEMARKLGAQIMGLGAFTKVVGDAGVTVARQAPLPITTGNSYSASAALWAAHDAMRRLKLVPQPRGQGRVAMKAMVVGATGAIGAACAHLLARAAQHLYLVAPDSARLLTLREAILQHSPDAQIHLAVHADRLLPEMDMVVTATSGAGKKVLDIMKVKPGCVITDVARPLDLPPEEVAKRPDVLVIESGEIEVPGDLRMKDIGLPPQVVYACLAETIVLTLAGRFEPYTVGRQIEWQKVHEIYQLGLAHGMRLAAISGAQGVFSDADIARVRRLALAARRRLARSRPLQTSAARAAGQRAG